MKDTKFRAQKSNAPSESLIWLFANTNPISFIHPFIICFHLFYAGSQGLESIPADFGLKAGHTLDRLSVLYRAAFTSLQYLLSL